MRSWRKCGIAGKFLYFIFLPDLTSDRRGVRIHLVSEPESSSKRASASTILDHPMTSAIAELARPAYPVLPDDSIYTSCYCEENVYLLAQAFYDQPSVREAWDIFVVFISNHSKTVCGASVLVISDLECRIYSLYNARWL